MSRPLRARYERQWDVQLRRKARDLARRILGDQFSKITVGIQQSGDYDARVWVHGGRIMYSHSDRHAMAALAGLIRSMQHGTHFAYK